MRQENTVQRPSSYVCSEDKQVTLFIIAVNEVSRECNATVIMLVHSKIDIERVFRRTALECED